MIASTLALGGYALLAPAWWCQWRGKHRAALVLLVLAAALLRTAPSLDEGLHPWDERFHALVAKNMLHAPFTPMLYTEAGLPHDDSDWTRAHVWLHKPPFSMWCISLSLKAFGTEAWAVRVPSILFACLAVVLCHALARLFASPRVAFWAALLLAINGHLIELASGRTSTDHPDAMLVVLVLAACYSALRMAHGCSVQWAAASGILAGLALLTKAWPSLLVFPVAAAGLWSQRGLRGSHAILLLIAMAVFALIVATPWYLHVRSAFPSAASIADGDQLGHFSTDVEAHARPWYYYLVQFPMIHGEAAPFAIAWVAFAAIRSRARWQLPIWAWVLVPYVLFSLSRSKMPAYTTIAAPAIFMLIAMAIEDPGPIASRSKATALLTRIVMLLLVLLPLRFSWDRVRPFHQDTGSVSLPPQVLHAAPRTVVIGCPDPISVMFHTEVAAAYSDALDPATIVRIRKAGYAVVDHGGE